MIIRDVKIPVTVRRAGDPFDTEDETIMEIPHVNYGWQRYSVWHSPTIREDDFWGPYMKLEWRIGLEIIINESLDTLTCNVLQDWWHFDFLRPEMAGAGFIDYMGWAWYDEKYRPEFDPQWFLNYDHPVPPYYDVNLGGPGENWEIVLDELGQVTNRTQSGFWDTLTFFYAWQRNDGKGICDKQMLSGRTSHTWDLTAEDFLENGQLRDRIVFYTYERHRDNGGDLWLGPPHKEEHAHWTIATRYWLTFADFNWKYHPLCIRKGDEWYSCNRLNSEVGHGDGHTMIRKGGRWNGVWNDDFYGNLESEGFYDDAPKGKEGEYTFLPRVGIGKDAKRDKESVHEWED